jgi:hemerythrin-like domain-containing protein
MTEKFTDVLDIVLQKHTEGKEKIVFLKDIVEKCSQDNVYEDTHELVKFFYFHIPVHFKAEEALIDILNNKIAKNSKETKCISEILAEHEVMLDKFCRLKELADKFKTRNNVREEYIELMNNLCEELAAHAAKEDNILFPMAKEKLTQDDLEKLKKAVAKIVY